MTTTASKFKKVLIMAGGTGGHVFPALAIAKRLREKNTEVHWLGTKKGMEARIVPEANFPLHFISIVGLRGKKIRTLLTAPWYLSIALFQALRIIAKLKPDIVIGMGGFVSGPGGLAAWLLRKKLIIHEQNAKPGYTNKWLAPFAKKILEGFPNTFPQSKKVVWTGNPVRTEIVNLPQPEKRFNDRENCLRLLVLGGSLGAEAINQLLPRVLAKFPLDRRPQVLHQTGEKHWENTIQAYETANIQGEIVPFIKEMNKAYEWADIVLCRSGASTIAELCVTGLGAVLVPFPFAIDDHQTANANFMAQNKAAILIQQKDLTEETLLEILINFFRVPASLLAMAKAAYELRKANATEAVIAECEAI